MEQPENSERNSQDKVEAGAEVGVTPTLGEYFADLEKACDVELVHIIMALFDGRHPQEALGTIAVAAINVCAASRPHLVDPKGMVPGEIIGRYILEKHDWAFQMIERHKAMEETKGNG